MATRILHRRGTGIPSADQFASTGEILIDTSTGTAYNLNDSGEVVALGGGSEGGSGAGMVISPDEPADPITGMQWLESTTGRVWIFDDGKWLEFPANVPAGEEYDDTELRGLISDEATAREEADNALGERIDNLDIPDVGSGLIEVSEEPPEPPYEIGQQWFSSTDGYLYIWYGAEWVATNMKSSGGGDSGGDPNFGNVDFLLNGEDGLADSTGNHTIIVNGDVPIETNIVKYGGGSIDLTSPAGHLAVESFGDLGGPFTVEAWVYPETILTSQIICHWRNADKGWTLSLNTNGTITSSISHDGGGVGGAMTSTDTMTAKQWHHVALTWDASIYRIFLDGKMSSEVYVSSEPPFNPPTADLTVGARFMSSGVGQYFNGYMDDIRITKGYCRYTADFEPPEEHPVGLQRTVYLPAAPMEIQEDSNDADLP